MLNRPVPEKSVLGSLGLITIIVTGIILLPMGGNSIAGADNADKDSRVYSQTNTIVPGVRVGNYKLGMSKDEVLRILRKTEGDSLTQAGDSISVDGLIINIVHDSVKLSFALFENVKIGKMAHSLLL